MARSAPFGFLGSWQIGDLVGAHKFLFGRYDEIPIEAVKFGSELHRNGLFRLPFDRTVMEFLAPPERNFERFVILCEQFRVSEQRQLLVDAFRKGYTVAGEPAPIEIPPIIVHIFPIVRGHDGGWTPIKTTEGYPLTMGTGAPTDGRIRVPQIYKDRKGWMELAAAAGNYCLAGTVMMMSRSVNRRHVVVPDKLQAARRRSGKEELFSFSLIEVPAKTRARTNNGNGSHASPRLHWRRGHYRKLALGKLVPVSPCLVGNIEAGAVEGVYEVSR